MKIGAPKETFDGEKRVAMTPQSAAALKKLGYECLIEAGAGAAARFSDAAYAEAGVEVVPTRGRALGPGRRRRQGSRRQRRGGRAGPSRARSLISFVYPAQNPELLESLKAKGVTAIAMDMVPRICRAQKMDALSLDGRTSPATAR